MKHDYKFRVDEPQPSEEQIERHRNFEGLLTDYSRLTQPIYRRPLYKNPRAFLGLVLILVIGYLVFEAVEEEEKAARLAETPIEVREAPQRAFLHPPAVGLAPQPITFDVPAYQDTTLTLPSGTRIVITYDPSESLDTTYRTTLAVSELNGPLDALLAGVPLQTSTGVQNVPSHVVQLKPAANFPAGPQFAIESAPSRNRPDRNTVLYSLDTAARQWQPIEEGFREDQRPVPGTNASMNDGFQVVEYGPDGSVAVQNVEEREDGGRTEWVRSYSLAPGSWMLSGETVRVPAADLEIQLVDGGGEPAEVYALYQFTEDRRSIRTYWPEDGEFYFTVAPGNQVFGFLKDGRLVWAKVPRTGGKLNYDISGDVVATKAELKKYLGFIDES